MFHVVCRSHYNSDINNTNNGLYTSTNLQQRSSALLFIASILLQARQEKLLVDIGRTLCCKKWGTSAIGGENKHSLKMVLSAERNCSSFRWFAGLFSCCLFCSRGCCWAEHPLLPLNIF